MFVWINMQNFRNFGLYPLFSSSNPFLNKSRILTCSICWSCDLKFMYLLPSLVPSVRRKKARWSEWICPSPLGGVPKLWMCYSATLGLGYCACVKICQHHSSNLFFSARILFVHETLRLRLCVCAKFLHPNNQVRICSMIFAMYRGLATFYVCFTNVLLCNLMSRLLLL